MKIIASTAARLALCLAVVVAFAAAPIEGRFNRASSNRDNRRHRRRRLRRKSEAPSAMPSPMPSAMPSDMPSAKPSGMPSATPTDTVMPSATPTEMPTSSPTLPFLPFNNFFYVLFLTTDDIMTKDLEMAGRLIAKVYNDLVAGYPNPNEVTMRLAGEITSLLNLRRRRKLSAGDVNVDTRNLNVKIEPFGAASLFYLDGECRKNSCDPHEQLFFEEANVNLPSLEAFYPKFTAAIVNMGGIGPILTALELREFNEFEEITDSPTPAPVQPPVDPPVEPPVEAPVKEKSSKSKKKKKDD